MTARRFTDKPDLDPTAVRELPPDHLAMVESRTLFPNTVVTVDENFEDRLLVSGRESRKLGETITKGQFKGYALYQLSLEERATCPADCEARSFCYGNGMQFGRRHRIVDEGFFFVLIEDEIREILSVEKHGLMVRLHVLGDFPSVSYVERWTEELASHPRLACFGYTHRKTHDDIGRATAQIGLTDEQTKVLWRRCYRMGEVTRQPPDGRKLRPIRPKRSTARKQQQSDHSGAPA